jgi:hypothetical protein
VLHKTLLGQQTVFSNFKNIKTHIFTVGLYTGTFLFMTATDCRYKNYRKISFPDNYVAYFMIIKWSIRVLHKTKHKGNVLNCLMGLVGI